MEQINLNDISILKMNKSDIGKIKEIETSQNVSIMSQINVEASLDNERSKYYIATINNNIIGYIAATFSVDFVDILSIVVKKEYQKNKIGSLLLKNIIDLSLEEKIDSIFLEVRKSNIAAQKLYESFDFIKISERKNYYRDNKEDAYIYLRQCQPLL